MLSKDNYNANNIGRLFYKDSTMFSFFSEKKESRFERCESLQSLPPLVKKLEKQIKWLRSQADVDSLAIQKACILEGLYEELTAAIKAFNQKNDDQVSQQDKINLVNTIKQKLLVTTSALNFNVLLAKRDSNREDTNLAIDVSVTGVALAFAFFLPLTFPVGLLSVTCAHYGNQAIRDVTELSDDRPWSARLVMEIEEAISKMEADLGIAKPVYTLTYGN
jgi:hypothetical protein